MQQDKVFKLHKIFNATKYTISYLEVFSNQDIIRLDIIMRHSV